MYPHLQQEQVQQELLELERQPVPEQQVRQELKQPEQEQKIKEALGAEDKRILSVSAADGSGIAELKERIARLAQTEEPEKYIVRDLIEPSDLVVLVVPIDKAAPKGRLILPQQQTIRDILEANAVSVVVKETELKGALERLGEKPPKRVRSCAVSSLNTHFRNSAAAFGCRDARDMPMTPPPVRGCPPGTIAQPTFPTTLECLLLISREA